MTTASKSAPLSVWRPIATDTFLVGAPHYPEHVDESYWQRDADRMAAAGFNAPPIVAASLASDQTAPASAPPAQDPPAADAGAGQ